MVSLAIILVRGLSGMKPEIKTTIHLLRLTRKNHCVIVNESIYLKGMLNVCKDFVTWGPISKETLTTLVEKRGRMAGDKPVAKEAVKKAVTALEKGEKPEIKPVFRLNSPRKGWKKMKGVYPNGAVGYRGDGINQLLANMM